METVIALTVLTSPIWLTWAVVHVFFGGWKQLAYKQELKRRMRAIEFGYNNEVINQAAVRELQRRGRL